MRHILLVLLLLSLSQALLGQSDEKLLIGEVSYITSQNVYVRFASTEGINTGDTIFIQQNENYMPVLIVQNLSSISCVCIPISQIQLSVTEKLVAWHKSASVEDTEIETPQKDPDIKPPEPIVQKTTEPVEGTIQKTMKPEPKINGRISISSYSNFSNAGISSTQRMRYVFSLNADNIGHSGLSFESYFSFSHRNNEWEEIKDNIYNGLKIYNLALNYNFNNDINLWFGRKINPKVSNVGAIDGLQFEKKFGEFTTGIIVGSRPDWQDYSFNFDLFQAGVYFSHELNNDRGNMQSTLSFFEQENNWKTDRRFIYFQHANRLIKKVYFFGSGEIDLYKKVNDTKENTFKLSNLYLSIRYRIFRQLSLSVSYSARNNLIYYETYKSFIDKLLETETLQGFTVSVNYRPITRMSIGARAGYRYRAQDLKPSRNLYTYISFSRIPVINTAATISATFLETSYISGRVYGIHLSHDLISGILFAGLSYRYIDYNFYHEEIPVAQHSLDINLNWRFLKTFFMSLNYESAFENEITFNRLYINLTKRF